MGLILSKLPVEVHIGKMLVLSTVFDVVETILTISAALSLQVHQSHDSRDTRAHL